MASAFNIGDLVSDRFRITQKVGRGSMGEVYKALDTALHRDVAIKTIRFDIIAEDSEVSDLRERFLREARTAAKLSHPNIVTVFDVGEWSGVSYMAIEFLDGVNLRSLIPAGRPFALEDCLLTAIQICQGLEEAHRCGVVHRDIKPANIMLVRESHVKIADFGIAKTDASASITREGAVMGTPAYMSPEQLRGEDVDRRSDIFSTGVVLYQMLTGIRPFTGENVPAIVLKVVSQAPRPIQSYNPDLPDSMQAILQRAMAKRPDDRYATMAELSADLEALAREIGLHAIGTIAGSSGSTGSTGISAATRAALTSGADGDTDPSDITGTNAPTSDLPRYLDSKYQNDASPLRKWLPFLAAAAAILLVGWLVVAARIGQLAEPTPPPADLTVASIGVLPFEGPKDPEVAWLSSGLALLFRTDLAQSPVLRVVSDKRLRLAAAENSIPLGERMSSDHIRALGAALNVHTLLTGIYDVTGDTMRFDVYLYEAATGKILVTDYEKRDLHGDFMSGVDNLTVRLRDSLGAIPQSEEDTDRDVEQLLTSDLAAFRHYVAGTAALFERDHFAAIAELNEATRLDPSFAAAHARKSETYAAMGRGELEQQARREAVAREEAKADQEAKESAARLRTQKARLERIRKRGEQRKEEEARARKDQEESARRFADEERATKEAARRAQAELDSKIQESTAPPATPTPVSEGTLVSFGELTRKPEELTRQPLAISSNLRRHGRKRGLIILSALVDHHGKVRGAKVLRSDIPLYNDAAIDSVRSWKYSPAEKDGVKVKTWVTVTMRL